ncbi:RNA polymerase sigma-70 factor (ECF subfamily) [Salana multivorans]|uniref:RNA polymerase sigma-70 factor (ECF subfamily) n=1 Tax=Salana multivorans TaxID=120377 RepID=A0A3N2D189_9MICO|nr:MAG: hypothetical protein BGO96_00805 [Micrococcales bacterium 73-15]ROR93254.1 RNA polymerase sigma-70 factor (ECF subfamily) [Salana multivorans]
MVPDPFVVFYREHYRLVLTIAQQRLGGLHEAEDVTAEVFRVAWLRYQETGEITLPWVYQTLRNVVGTEYRRRSRAPITGAEEELLALVRDDDGAIDTRVVVRRELAAIDERDRELLYMAFWEDLRPDEIAAILGCRTATVRVRLHRARARLRTRLAAALASLEGEVRDGRP